MHNQELHQWWQVLVEGPLCAARSCAWQPAAAGGEDHCRRPPRSIAIVIDEARPSYDLYPIRSAPSNIVEPWHTKRGDTKG